MENVSEMTLMTSFGLCFVRKRIGIDKNPLGIMGSLIAAPRYQIKTGLSKRSLVTPNPCGFVKDQSTIK